MGGLSYPRQYGVAPDRMPRAGRRRASVIDRDPFMSFDPRFMFSGFFVGLLIGQTGMGGGSLMTPILVLFFGIHPATAVGTDLLYASATKTAGTLVHGLNHTVDWRIVARLACGSVPATMVTLVAISHFDISGPTSGRIISLVLGVMLLLTAVSLIFRRRFLRAGRTGDWSVSRRARRAVLTIVIGVVLGVLVTISSVGAGALGVTALLMLYPRVPMAVIVGSDIAHAVPLTLVAGLGHWWLGSVDWPLLASLLGGSIPGIVLGSYLSAHIPDAVLRPILAVTLIVVGRPAGVLSRASEPPAARCDHGARPAGWPVVPAVAIRKRTAGQCRVWNRAPKIDKHRSMGGPNEMKIKRRSLGLGAWPPPPASRHVAPPRAKAPDCAFHHWRDSASCRLFIALDRRLIEAHAASLGLENLQIKHVPLRSAVVSTDALLAGQLDVIAGTMTSLLVLWDKTNGDVRSVSDLGGQVLTLVTRNPNVHSIVDFGPTDRIAVPSVKQGPHSLVIGMALDKALGPGSYRQIGFDPGAERSCRCRDDDSQPVE